MEEEYKAKVGPTHDKGLCGDDKPVIARPKEPRRARARRLCIGNLNTGLAKEIKGENQRHKDNHGDHRVETDRPK